MKGVDCSLECMRAVNSSLRQLLLVIVIFSSACMQSTYDHQKYLPVYSMKKN